MTEAIIVAIITGAMTFAGVLVANGKTQAVTKERLDELTLLEAAQAEIETYKSALTELGVETEETSNAE